MNVSCVVCGSEFTKKRRTDKTCSVECSVQHRRKINREKAARHYKPRPPRPDAICIGCGASVPAPRSGPMPTWCSPCRANHANVRSRERTQSLGRTCYKCGGPTPEAIGRPGRAVCEDCRVDVRDREAQLKKERRRTLRRYGLTQDDFDRMLADQDQRCLTCGTLDPGRKGWNIDHCHSTGTVRAILCHRCNTALGLVREDPTVLRAMADMMDRYRTDKDIV